MKHIMRAALAAFLLSAGLSHAAEIESLDVVDASNTTRWAENMSPSAVNDSARALEAIIARWHEDSGCRKATTGSADTYAFAAAQTLSAYYDGLVICADIHATNTTASTLNVDAIGAKNILKHNDQALDAGDLEAGQKALMVYDGTSFQLLSGLGVKPAVVNADNNFTADQTIIDTDGSAAEGPALDLYRNSASPAGGDLGGVIRGKGEDSGGVDIETYAKWALVIDDATDTTEDGHWRIDAMVAGTLTAGMHIGTSIYAEGNTDPGAGKIDADGLLISGEQVEATSLDTPQATTSGTSFDFTSPFATTTRAIVTFQDVSLSGGDDVLIQIGPSGGVATSGYDSGSGAFNASAQTFAASTAGFIFRLGGGGTAADGNMRLVLADSSNNDWTEDHSGLSTTATSSGGGRVTLSGVQNKLKILATGSNTFDAGEVNVRWHGHN